MGLLKKIGKIAGGIITGNPGAVISGVAGIVSSKKSKKGAKQAAAVQSDSYNAAAGLQRNALADVKAIQAPYSDVGTKAIGQINSLNAGDYSGFMNSPDYQFALQKGGRAVDRSAAARGNLNSGNTLIAQQRFGQGLATENLGNFRNSLFQQLNTGQRAADMTSTATTGTASNVGNLLIGGADARASGIVAGTNATTNGIDQVAGAVGDILGNTLVKKPKKPKMALNYVKPALQRAV